MATQTEMANCIESLRVKANEAVNEDKQESAENKKKICDLIDRGCFVVAGIAGAFLSIRDNLGTIAEAQQKIASGVRPV